jgi:hypothetical protein
LDVAYSHPDDKCLCRPSFSLQIQQKTGMYCGPERVGEWNLLCPGITIEKGQREKEKCGSSGRETCDDRAGSHENIPSFSLAV